MHLEAFEFVRHSRDRLKQFPRQVVEIGSRDVNGSVRPLFAGSKYTGIDLREGPGVDIVVDGSSWQPDYRADLVLCLETLEHSPSPELIIVNALRMLDEGGTLIVTAASDPRAPHSGIDGGPLRAGEYYGNISEIELCRWLKECQVFRVEKDSRCGDVRAVATI